MVRDERRGAIYVADADGGNRRAIVPSVGLDCVWMAWSPNGRKIAFTRNEGWCDGSLIIYVLDADGTRLRRLTRENQGMDAVWSPDGRSILFAGLGHALWLMDADGRRKRRIPGSRPEVPDGRATRPQAVWAPDGRTIYFIGDVAGDDSDSAVF